MLNFKIAACSIRDQTCYPNETYEMFLCSLQQLQQDLIQQVNHDGKGTHIFSASLQQDRDTSTLLQ